MKISRRQFSVSSLFPVLSVRFRWIAGYHRPVELPVVEVIIIKSAKTAAHTDRDTMARFCHELISFFFAVN